MQSKIRFYIPIIAFFLVIFLWGNAYTQVIYIDISGTVTDEEGRALPGTNVEILNNSTGFKRATTTDAGGRYLFKSIPSQGKYQIKADISGFTIEIKKGFEFSMNQTYIINFTLKMSALEEFITVEATAPLVDVKRKTIQQTFTEDLIRAIPLGPADRRSFLHLAGFSASAAGVTPGQVKYSMSGQHWWGMNHVVDGSSNFYKWGSIAMSGGAFYSSEMIKEVQLLSHQFSVEFGEGMAAVTSAITKSGTNEFHGSFSTFVFPGDWSSPDLMTGVKKPYDQQMFTFTLGGPIKKDKIHFFATYENRRRRSTNVLTSPLYYGQTTKSKLDEHLALVKIDYQLSNTDYLSFRFNFIDSLNDSGPSGYTAPGEGRTTTDQMYNFNLGWTKNLSSVSINELRLQFLYVDHIFDTYTSRPDGTAGESRSGWISIGASENRYTHWGTDPEISYELFDKLSWQKGNHFFKAGIFGKYVYSGLPFLPYPNGFYWFKGSPDEYPEPYRFRQGFALDPSLAEIECHNISGGLFFEDEWSVSRKLTLTLGARYSVEKPFGLKEYNSSLDANNIAPRLGFAYDVVGDGKSVIRGGVGVFYQQHLTYHYTKCDFMGPEGIIQITLAADSPYFPTYPSYLPDFPEGVDIPARDIWEVDDHFKNPYSIQVTLGYKREIIPTLSFGVDFVYMTVYDAKSVIDRNAPASTKPVPQTVAEADATRPIIPAPNGFRIINHLGNLGRSWYQGIEMTLEKRASDFSFLLSYNFSKATDMLNPWALPEDSNNLDAEKGPAASDQRHRLRLGFFYRTRFKNILLKDWQIAGNFVAQSAGVYTELWGYDIWGNTQVGTRNGWGDARVGERNNLRGDPYYNIDFALSRMFVVKDFQLELKVETFNPFNILNYTRWVDKQTHSLPIGSPLRAATARRWQIAFIIRF